MVTVSWLPTAGAGARRLESVIETFYWQAASSSLLVRDAIIMLAQEVVAEVAFEIAPDRVDMVGVVLGIVVFQKEGRALHPIVVSFLGLDAPGPGEIQILRSRVLDSLQVPVRDFRAIAVNVFP